MALTDKLSEVTAAQVTLFKTNAGALGIAALPDTNPSVFFGDQSMIPVTPTICVDPSNRRLGPAEGSGFKVDVTFTTLIYVYHGKIQDVQDNLKEALQFAEACAALLHANKQLGGIIVHGHCLAIDLGFVARSRTLMRVSRITWQGLSKSTT